MVCSACLVLIVSSLLAAVSNVEPQAKPVKQKAKDPVVQTVESLLQQPRAFSTGFSEKQSGSLGDQVSTALLKIFNAKEIEDPRQCSKVLADHTFCFSLSELDPADQVRRLDFYFGWSVRLPIHS